MSRISTLKATSSHKASSTVIRLLSRSFMLDRHGKLAGRHWLTLCGIALGVFALLSVSSVMNGFDRDMRQRIIGTRAEIRITKPQTTAISDYASLLKELSTHKDIAGASPSVRNEMMLVNGGSMAASVTWGVNLPRQQSVSPVLRPVSHEQLIQKRNTWFQGIVQGETDTTAFNNNGIILGADLAQMLHANVGDTIRLVSPLGDTPTPFGMMPKTREVKVIAIFIAGMPEYDRLYSYIPLDMGQFFSDYSSDQIDQIEVRTTSFKRLKSITSALQKSLPDYVVEDWSRFDTSLYAAMHFEKYLMLIILGLMFVMAAFNMSGNVYRTIALKRRSIGILKTIGLDKADILLIFMRQGLTLAVGGILSGILLAILLLFAQKTFGIISLPVGNMPNLVLPVDIRLWDFILIPSVSFILTWLSIYLPARKAGKIDPILLIREHY